MHSLPCFFARGIVPSRVQIPALGRELSIARKQRKLPDKSRSHLCRYIPVVKYEPKQGSGPLQSSQSIAAKYLCQILDALKTNRGKLGQRLFSSQGWVWVTEMFSFFFATQSMVPGPSDISITVELLAIQNLRPHTCS